MYHHPKHFARHLRQLNYLRKLCNQYQQRGSFSHKLMQWIRKKLQFLTNRLLRRVTPQRWIGAASCIVAFLQTQGVTLNAQHFLPKVINPFQISDLSEHGQHAVLDLDNDGDIDLLYVSYGAQYEFELRFRENISTKQAPAFPGSSVLSLNTGQTSFDNFVYTTGDLDNDGDFDVLACTGYAAIPVGYSYRYEPVIAFIENIGTPEAANYQLTELDTLNTSIFNQGVGIPNLVDIDDDGDLDLYMDLLIYNFGFEINEMHPVYYKNVGTPAEWNFISGAQEPFNYQFPQGVQYMLHDFGDIDNDGDLDILAQAFNYDDSVQGYISNYMYYENAGDPANPFFAPLEENPFNLPGDQIDQQCIPVLADWDKDGDLDLSCTVVYDNTVANLVYFENIGSSSVESERGLKHSLFDVLPVPANSYLDIQIEAEGASDAQIAVTDVHGRKIYEDRISGQTYRINCENWMPGSYIVRIVNEKHSASKVVQVLR